MSDFDDFNEEFYNFKETDVKDMTPLERNTFIEFVYQDYKFVCKENMAPKVIKYHSDVLSKLIKTYGH